MNVITALARTGFAIRFEGLFDLVEMVGFGSKVAERMIACLASFSHGSPELQAIQAVQAVTFNHGGIYVLTAENVFKSALGGSSAGAR